MPHDLYRFQSPCCTHSASSRVSQESVGCTECDWRRSLDRQRKALERSTGPVTFFASDLPPVSRVFLSPIHSLATKHTHNTHHTEASHAMQGSPTPHGGPVRSLVPSNVGSPPRPGRATSSTDGRRHIVTAAGMQAWRRQPAPSRSSSLGMGMQSTPGRTYGSSKPTKVGA